MEEEVNENLLVYVAGASSERDLVRSLMSQLPEGYHTFVGEEDWTSDSAHDDPSLATPEHVLERAGTCLGAVARADIVWYVAPQAKSEGSHAEIGYALALGKVVIASGPWAEGGRIFPLRADFHFKTHGGAFAFLTDARAALVALARGQKCRCRGILALDASRHFRECPHRETYPKPGALPVFPALEPDLVGVPLFTRSLQAIAAGWAARPGLDSAQRAAWLAQAKLLGHLEGGLRYRGRGGVRQTVDGALTISIPDAAVIGSDLVGRVVSGVARRHEGYVEVAFGTAPSCPFCGTHYSLAKPKAEERDACVDCAERLAADARGAEEAERKLSGVAAELTAALERERGLRKQLRAVQTDIADVWFWMGNDFDEPESLTCPVVMTADRLRSLLAARDDVRCPLVGVAVAVVRPRAGGGHEILLGKRLGSHGAGTWGVSGGYAEAGEALATTAARELREETGLDLPLERFWPIPAPPVIVHADKPWGRQGYATLFAACRVAPASIVTICEPDKTETWRWFGGDDAWPDPLFEPLGAAIGAAEAWLGERLSPRRVAAMLWQGGGLA